MHQLITSFRTRFTEMIIKIINDNTGQHTLTNFLLQKLQYTFPKHFGVLKSNLVAELLYHV